MKATARLGVLTAATAAVIGFGAAQAMADQPAPPPVPGPADTAPAAPAGPAGPAEPGATVPTWDDLKSLTVEEAVQKVPADLQKKTTSDPLYPLLKGVKLELLPANLQEEIKTALVGKPAPEAAEAAPEKAPVDN